VKIPAKAIYFTIIILILSFACQMKSQSNYENEKTDDPAYRAYELRINGQADSAKVLLEKSLKKDSTSALA